MYYFFYYINVFLTRRTRHNSRLRKKTLPFIHSAGDVSAVDWISQTRVKNYRNFSRLVIRFFWVVEIPTKHSSLYNKHILSLFSWWHPPFDNMPLWQDVCCHYRSNEKSLRGAPSEFKISFTRSQVPFTDIFYSVTDIVHDDKPVTIFVLIVFVLFVFLLLLLFFSLWV